MKKLKTLWAGIPRIWKLALNGLLILLLLAGSWAMLDYPSFSAASAYRRGLRDAGLPDSSMELLVDTDWFPLAIGTDAEYTYVTQLGGNSKYRLWTCYDTWRLPASEGVWYADLRWEDGPHTSFPYEPDDGAVPVFAVKAEGADASLRLVLEDGVTVCPPEWEGREEQIINWVGGSYELIWTEHKDGWFIFAFDPEFFREKLHYSEGGGKGFEEPVLSLKNWIYDYYGEAWQLPDYHLELITYDEDGKPLDTVSWTPMAGREERRAG